MGTYGTITSTFMRDKQTNSFLGAGKCATMAQQLQICAFFFAQVPLPHLGITRFHFFKATREMIRFDQSIFIFLSF